MSITGTVNALGNDSAAIPTEPIPEAVLVTPQQLTETQRAQVRTNIGAVSTQEVNAFVRAIAFNAQNGELSFTTDSGVQRIQLPLFDALQNIRIEGNELVVESNNPELNHVIALPSNSTPIRVNDVVPDVNGLIRIMIANIPELSNELTARATTTDIQTLRGLKVLADENARTLTLVDAADVELHTFDVSWLANSNANKTPKSEYFRLTQEILDEDESVINLKLDEIPTLNEHVMVFCNGILLNAEGIDVQDNFIYLSKGKVDYDFKAGMKITVAYKY